MKHIAKSGVLRTSEYPKDQPPHKTKLTSPQKLRCLGNIPSQGIKSERNSFVERVV